MAAQSQNSFSLKAMVHKDSNRVLFVESDNYFVDVLFSFLTMPMGTIVRLSDSHLPPMRVGCMNNLYASVENIDLQLLNTEECRAMLLHPRNAAESLLRCLKLKIDDSEPMHYLCDNQCCAFYRNSFSYYASVPCCGCGKLMDLGVNFLVKGGRVGGVFVDGLDKFIISDDLQVMLPFTSEFSSYLSKCGVVDLNDIEELTFNVGVDEVVSLLLGSLVLKTPFTETLLKPKPESQLVDINKARDQKISIISKVARGTNDTKTNVVVNLIVSKSTKRVCYAEAGADFVNLLFSFLAVPLGFILKQMADDSSWTGCIDNLYKSVEDIDGKYLKSIDHRTMLLNPKLAQGFSYANYPFGIEEATIYTPIKSATPIFVDPKSPYHEGGCVDECVVGCVDGFLKGPVMFMVTDNLIVRPLSPTFGLSILKQLNVPITDIEVQTVNLGKVEAVCLLVAALCFDSPLTVYYCFLQTMGEKSMNKISLKVLMNNLTNKVIFAEGDSDFIDVLLSFLTIPLGKIVRLSNRSQPLRIGCMDNLYGSVENLDLQHFRTAECRDMLLHPRSRAEDFLMNLKLKCDQFEPSRYFKCSNESCRSPIQSYSYYETVCCWCKCLD
ncbi:hypothetical protein TB2_038531 [Malus domestica]